MMGFDNLMRRCFPRTYGLIGFRHAERENQRQMRAAGHLSAEERRLLRLELHEDTREWNDWLTEIDDKRLVAKAAKMDVDLDDIPLPPPEELDQPPNHYVLGGFGNRYLALDTREALRAKIRERAPIYRKERREVIELYIKAGTVIVGILGAATGFVAILTK